MKMVGAFVACGLEPQGIIAMDFSNLELNPKPTHWCLHGMCDDELTMLYEEKNGIVLRNLFLH